MGSTVFVQASVHSFPTRDGRVGYVWSEETYDKRNGPREASWCVMRIGYRQQMIERIFGLASSIPGGSLRVKNNSAKSFITAMLAKLDAPLALTSTTVAVENSVDGFYAGITDKNRAAAQAVFSRHGKQDFAQAIAASPQAGGAKTIGLDLATDLDLILEMMSCKGAEIYPWRIMQTRPYSAGQGVGERHISAPFRGVVELSILDSGVMDFEALRLCILGGEPLILASGYDIEQELIRHAAEHEMTHPGYYKAVLGQFAKVKDLPMASLPVDTVFEIDATGAHPWLRDQAARACMVIHGQEDQVFTATMAQVKDGLAAADRLPPDECQRAKYCVTQLLRARDVIKVHLPDAESEIQAPSLETMSG